ncbi:STK17B [Cordylochernes scorpioides]|nr:STK17B [Cordylochernes scorpioides]
MVFMCGVYRGKFAAVKRCRHRASGTLYAAKCLRRRRAGWAAAVHEAAVLQQCRGARHVVGLHEAFDGGGELTLVLELAGGGELQHTLDRGDLLGESLTCRLLAQTLRGLAPLHALRIAHLDIKPQNILLTAPLPDGDVKLCDFGISRVLSEGVEVREIIGTPDYVAPEILHYNPISLATDMWSVGVLAYVLLSGGHSPFGGESVQETYCNITQCRLDFPPDLFSDVSSVAIDFVRSLLRPDPR